MATSASSNIFPVLGRTPSPTPLVQSAMSPMICFTADGAPVSVFSSNGSCPSGLFTSKPPTEDTFVDPVRPDVYPNSPYPPPNNTTEEDEPYVQDPIDYSQIVVCHSPCVRLSGSANKQSTSVSVPSGVCPPSYPFYSKPDCEIPDDVQALMDAYQAQIDALEAEASQSDSSQEIDDLNAQIEALKDNLASSQTRSPNPYLEPTKQAGFGNIPMWAIIAGVGLVVVIALMGSRRQQPVVVKG